MSGGGITITISAFVGALGFRIPLNNGGAS
jgi:hypothetical protein